MRLELSAKLRASIAGGQIRSAPVVVALEPLLTISSTARATKVGRSIPVSTRLSPAKAATRVTLYECSPYTHGWHAVAAKPPGLSGRITFRWTAGYGRTLLRAEVERRDAAPGFRPGQSSTIAVTATGAAPGGKNRPRLELLSSERPRIDSGTSIPSSSSTVGATSSRCIPSTGPGSIPGPAMIRRPSWAWFASSGPVSFSKVWIPSSPPTVPTERHARSPK